MLSDEGAWNWGVAYLRQSNATKAKQDEGASKESQWSEATPMSIYNMYALTGTTACVYSMVLHICMRACVNVVRPCREFVRHEISQTRCVYNIRHLAEDVHLHGRVGRIN